MTRKAEDSAIRNREIGMQVVQVRPPAGRDAGREDRSYSILIDHGILGTFGNVYRQHDLGGKAVVITDRIVAQLYLPAMLESLTRAGVRAFSVVLPPGEKSKTLDTAGMIYGQLIEERLERTSTVVALGGGMVGDIAGFVAATFMRGIALVQVPTTILAQVDSSVGGKTAVDHRLGKNMIGAFHQPKFVFVDSDVLTMLPEREVRSGMGEVVKHAMIRSEELFEFVERHAENILRGRAEREVMEELIGQNCRIKAEVVSEDPLERGVRAILNYGHTVGHAIEALTGYTKYRHGEAVMLGMVAAGEIAVRKGMLSRKELERQNSLVARVGVPEGIGDLSADAILEQIQLDKKVHEGKVRFVLPERIGSVVVRDDVAAEEIRGGIEYMRAWCLRRA